METTIVQARLPKNLIKQVDGLVKKGNYLNRSDAIRQSLRGLIFDEYLGIIADKTDSVKQIRKARKELSKQPIDLEEINELFK